MKERTSFALSPECKELLRLLAAQLGLSQASVIEMAVRHEADWQHAKDSVPELFTPEIEAQITELARQRKYSQVHQEEQKP